MDERLLLSFFFESQHGYYNAIYSYEDLEIHKGTAEEINHYIERKLSGTFFFWYLAKSSRILQDCIPFCNSLAIIFIYSHTRKTFYELLHTKPVTAIQYRRESNKRIFLYVDVLVIS